MSTEPEKVTNVTGTPSYDRIEPVGRLPNDSLQSLTDNLGFSKRQFSDARGQERYPALPRLHHRQTQPRIDELEWDSRDTRTRPGIQNIASFHRKDPTEQEAIEEYPLDDPSRLG